MTMPKTLAMRAFAIGYVILALTIVWILVTVVIPRPAILAAESVRMAILGATLILAAVLAALARSWPVRSDRAGFWLIGTVPAIVFFLAFVDPLGANVFKAMELDEFLSSLVSMLAAAVAIVSGVVAYGEARSDRAAVSPTFRDRRFMLAAGLVAALVVVSSALWVGRLLPRGEVNAGPGQGGPQGQGVPQGSGNPPPATPPGRRPPGEGVRMQTLGQGNLAMPSGTLTISYLEIQHSGGLSHSHDAGFVYMLEGEQKLSVDSAPPQTLGAGQAAFVPAAAAHEHTVSGSAARWLFVGARAGEVAERDFKFQQQSIVFRSAELPSLPAGANTDTLMLIVFERDAEMRPATTGGVMALLALEGEVDVLAGPGNKSLRKGQGSHLLQGSPFVIVNKGQGEARVLAFFLAPEGRPPLIER